MNPADFRRLDKDVRQVKPKLFLLTASDPPATEEQLLQTERLITVALSPSYRSFLKEFGGGSFGLTTVFSADANSEWFLPRKLEEAKGYLPSNTIPFADDFAGGAYVLEVTDGKAAEPVFYWNQDGGLVPTKFSDVFEFVARYAYEPA